MANRPKPSKRESFVHGQSHMKLPALLFNAPPSLSWATLFPTKRMNRMPGMVNLWR
jgi:hypothetical protein